MSIIPKREYIELFKDFTERIRKGEISSEAQQYVLSEAKRIGRAYQFDAPDSLSIFDYCEKHNIENDDLARLYSFIKN